MTIAIVIFLAIGVFFAAVGVLGILRMHDVYERLQASTCTATLGMLCFIIAGILYAIHNGMGTGTYVKLAILMLLVFFSNPISNHALCRAAYRAGIKPAQEPVIDDYKEDEVV